VTDVAAPKKGGALGILSGNTLIYLAGSLSAKLAAFLMLPILTPVLTPEDFGVLELTDATLSLLLQLIGFQLDAALTRFYFDQPEGKARDRVVSTAFLSLGMMTAAAALALYLSSGWLADWLLERPDLPHAMQLVALILGAMVLSDVSLSVLKAQQKSIAVTGWQLLRLLFELSGKIVLVVVFSWGVIGVLAGQAIAAVTFVIGFSIWLVRRFGLGFDAKLLKSMVAFSAPMVLAGLCAFLLHSADRFMLAKFASMYSLGLYGIGYRFGYAVTAIVLSAFLLIWFPFIFSVEDKDERKHVLSQAALFVPAVLLMLSLPVALFAPELVALFTDKQYFYAWHFVPVIMFGYLAWGAFQVFQTPFFVHKKTSRLPVMVGMAAVINISFNVLLLPILKTMGAAYATVIAQFFLAFVVRSQAQKLEAFPVAWRRFVPLLVICAVAGVSLYVVPIEGLTSMLIRGGVLVASGLYLVGPFLKKEERAQVVTMVRSFLNRGSA